MTFRKVEILVFLALAMVVAMPTRLLANPVQDAEGHAATQDAAADEHEVDAEHAVEEAETTQRLVQLNDEERALTSSLSSFKDEMVHAERRLGETERKLTDITEQALTSAQELEDERALLYQALGEITREYETKLAMLGDERDRLFGLVAARVMTPNQANYIDAPGSMLAPSALA